MSATEVLYLDATAQAELLRRGEISRVELAGAAIERLERLNGDLNAVVTPTYAQARKAARDAEPSGPFAGVPFLLKDIGAQEAGVRYCAGMRALKEAQWIEREDAFLTQRFHLAGLISLGRTNTPELGLLPTTEPQAFGPSRNPWNLDHSPGGSSGGAAAAVAAGIVPLAHASDGGGSIRIPASACGLVGLKPTRARTSFGPGLGERWNGFSSEFVVARSLRDIATLLDAISGAMPGDPYTAPPPAASFSSSLDVAVPSLRIGMMARGARGEEVDGECRAAVRHTAALLRDAGHEIEESYPEAMDDPDNAATYVDIVAANTARALLHWGEAVGRTLGEADVEPVTWFMAERGRALSATDLLQRLEYVHRLGRRMAAWWQGGFDLLLTPTVGAPPPPIGALTSTAEEPLRPLFGSAPYGMFTLPFNMTGQPAISVPLYRTREGVAGLPIGCQLVAPFGREDLLLQIAAQLEEIQPWIDERPPLGA